MHFETPMAFFPDLVLRSKYLQQREIDGKPVNPNATWREAEYLVYKNLKIGVHPSVIDQVLRRELDGLKVNPTDDYHEAYLKDSIRALKNLDLESRFNIRGLPDATSYCQMFSQLEKLYNFEMCSHVWYGSFAELRFKMLDASKRTELFKYGCDLDNNDEGLLEKLRMRVEERIDEHYRDNEEFLIQKFGWDEKRFRKANIPNSIKSFKNCPETGEVHVFTPHPNSPSKILETDQGSYNGISNVTQLAKDEYAELIASVAATSFWPHHIPQLPYFLGDPPTARNNRKARSKEPSAERLQLGIDLSSKSEAEKRRILERRRKVRRSASPTPTSRKSGHESTLSQFDLEYEEEEDDSDCPLERW